LVLGTAYLLFALVMTMAARFDELRSLIPPEIYGAFNPNDKTNLAPYRLLHFVVFAFFVVRLLPRDWPGLEWRIFRPAIKCGQQSLEVFCAGIFLSFAAHVVLVEISGAIWMQIVVSIVGILMMTALAYTTGLGRRTLTEHRRRLSRSSQRQVEWHLGDGGFGQDQIRPAALF
jgi:hypothetical protein